MATRSGSISASTERKSRACVIDAQIRLLRNAGGRLGRRGDRSSFVVRRNRRWRAGGYLTIVKRSFRGADFWPAALVAVITSV